ncbi:ubiquitin-activating E1 FCCH domain-containing protein [Brevundimonas sp. GCM10030266]|uniref:ubiquitin-activating E1 FCCH domain-containing protein n=1 Tax=Brevundimonas sp. GCM10030266 TaxID=3273386 RepID=UPI00366E9C8E
MTFGQRISRIVRGGEAFLRRLAGETRGNVALIFGLSLPVLILMTMGGVDIHRASTVRVNLQDALDAAALHAARSPYTSNTDIQRVGMIALKANLKAYPNILLREADTTFVLNSDDVVIADAKVDVKTLVANIFLPPYGKFMDDYIKVGAHSEVDRSSRNVEVSLVLDVTGSMDGDRISALRQSAKDLVDLVVQDVQSPYYSKVALVPYSNSVNPGTYLNTVRGSVTGSTNISGAVLNLTGNQRTITAATRARPVVITSNGHGFSDGDVVWITGVSGMTQLNNKAYVVDNKTTNTFELYTTTGSRVDGRNYGVHLGSTGRVQKCQNNNCSVTITANGHGLRNNEYVRLTDIGGMTALNNQTFLVGNVSTNTYTIDPSDTATLSPYSSGGRSWCAQQGCTWFAFENMNEDLQTNLISDCVTERTGSNRYTEVSGSSSRVARHYTQDGTCLTDAIVPLSSDRTMLKNRINNFTAVGGTAGQIGIGWGWYMVSPNWNTVWPSSGAGAYNSADTLKAVVIMTDGEFNTPYCQGVISRDAGSGSGSNTYKINCAPDNADPYTQSRALCDAMKAQNVVVYTVGLGISSTGQAADLLRYCATGSGNFYMADDSSDLSGAFGAIGRDITQLRISK